MTVKRSLALAEQSTFVNLRRLCAVCAPCTFAVFVSVFVPSRAVMLEPNLVNGVPILSHPNLKYPLELAQDRLAHVMNTFEL
jgi:hypothetical protein